MKVRRRHIGVALIVAAVVWSTAALWVWALAGMSEEVAEATVWTAFILMSSGIGITLTDVDL